MTQHLEQITQWLDNCKGHTLYIEKREGTDEDLTRLRLHTVSVTDNPSNRLDDYIPDRELILHGTGYILNLPEHQPLPRDQYEIPLVGEWHGNVQNETVQLITDRAVYHIKMDDNGQM